MKTELYPLTFQGIDLKYLKKIKEDVETFKSQFFTLNDFKSNSREKLRNKNIGKLKKIQYIEVCEDYTSIIRNTLSFIDNAN
jgi:hypothetical protein